ncbi:MAG TPA: hypothetical protein VIL64_03295 [Solirubrobacteraceae bacterium]|jgi:hypothetical protein
MSQTGSEGHANGRQSIERRSPVGARLFATLATAGEPATFDELAQLAIEAGTPLREMVRWLAIAEVGGVLEPVQDEAFAVGVVPRRFVLTDFGRRVAEEDRRGSDRRAA